jgi:hypothetical protein
MTLWRGDVLGNAAVFAASGVKSGVICEGGATPSISRGLDPRLAARAGPAGVAPPSPVTKNRIARRHGPRSVRDPVAIATGPCR